MKKDIFFEDQYPKLPAFLQFFNEVSLEAKSENTEGLTNETAAEMDSFKYYGSPSSYCTFPTKPISKLLIDAKKSL